MIKVNDRVKVKSKYFNQFNDLEGTVIGFDDWGDEKIHVKIDHKEGIQVFQGIELKKIKE